jgi:hypothetical protein
MTRIFVIGVGLFIGLIACADQSAAQVPPGNPWSHGTTLGLSAGSAIASSETRGTLGTALGWEMNHWVEIEGTGAWLVARHGDEAFAAELKLLANLTRPNRIVPFLGAGVGMYRASFDTTNSTLPDFYQRRVSSSLGMRQTFTDPSFVFAAGMDIFSGKHLSIRPDLSVRLVSRASDTYAVTIAAVRVTYHFENHERTW